MKAYVVVLIVLGVAMPASAQDIDRFRYFESQGVMDPGVSPSAANALVSEGIAQTDPAVVDMTIRGLGNLAMVLAHNLPHAFGNLPTRTFRTVPGLKEFLIRHWRVQHEKTGRNSFEIGLKDVGLESLGGTMATGPTAADLGLEEDEIVGYFENLLDSSPPWPMIPQILAVFWPGDPDVEQFLFEMQETDQSPTKTLTTLSLLNTGTFTSEGANGFRIAQLRNPNLATDAPIAATWAAEGLALSRPVEALPVLIEAGKEYSNAREAVFIALAGYQEIELRPYATEIEALLKGGIGVMPEDAATQAFEKLGRLVPPVNEQVVE